MGGLPESLRQILRVHLLLNRLFLTSQDAATNLAKRPEGGPLILSFEHELGQLENDLSLGNEGELAIDGLCFKLTHPLTPWRFGSWPLNFRFKSCIFSSHQRQRSANRDSSEPFRQLWPSFDCYTQQICVLVLIGPRLTISVTC